MLRVQKRRFVKPPRWKVYRAVAGETRVQESRKWNGAFDRVDSSRSRSRFLTGQNAGERCAVDL